MSEQPARSYTAATHRSAHPNIPGVPWWGAVVIAVTSTTIGFAFDAGSGDKELSSVFAALYFLGCVAAVLAVRQNGVFTAVVQPPLILFVAVPGAYFLFHQSDIDGLKDILINCGYPLIERFVLMFTTSVVVLLIGAARWYFGAGTITAVEETGDDEIKAPAKSGVRAKLSALVNGTDADDLADDDGAQQPRKHGNAAGARRGSTRRTSTSSTKGRSKNPPRSRHARPPIDDLDAESPRRRRPARPDLNEDPEAPPRRRPRPTRDQPREPGARGSGREYRPRERDPRDREPLDPYERPRRRPNRYDSYDPAEAFDAPLRPRRPAAGTGTGTGTSSHHPVSRVRYRGTPDEGGDDDRVEYRTRPRSRHSLDSDRWRYDA
ncbi:DUF6542 domain-containing protein [Mycolicibacterium mengxianglii]|uniref:DUF6542 domain-containing protein n=1 Tax=Mycolicibacterium mengxianglii TaxID=2736649 RepID=UPI0018EF0EB0|nr:DUF6542 domain-containing protein [Mycolicibacterium mengxianglii]